MKRNTTKLILKLFCAIALITATTAVAVPSSEACNDCMVTWSGGQMQAGCWNCGPLGREECSPAGDHCDMDGAQCDAREGTVAVCPPQN
jgi:hypothetical protein